MRIDSHHHLWRYEPAAYPWIQPSMAILRRDYLLPDLAPLLAAARLDGAITVQAQQTLAETEWLLDIAATSREVRGVVGWAPLIDAGVADTFDRLARHPALRGVRHILHDEPDDDYMLRDDFGRGLAQLTALDLVYDLLVFAKHLPAAVTLVDRHPRQRFVLDHIGKPTIAAGQFDQRWARDLRALAERPHVACKLSGLVTEVRGATWSTALLEPYVETALEAFGPDRLMFGTDWPVCLLRCEYAEWVTTVGSLIAMLSADEQRGIMGENAARIYRLELAPDV